MIRGWFVPFCSFAATILITAAAAQTPRPATPGAIPVRTGAPSGANDPARPEAQIPARLAPANITASKLTKEQMERFLVQARIIGIKPVGLGITHTRRVSMTDGRYTHDAHIQDVDIYKPEYRTKEGIERNFRDSYKYNIAAYRLDKMMDLNMSPVCVERVFEGKPCAFCWWIDDIRFVEVERRDQNVEPPDAEYWTRQLNVVRVFDQLIFNTDRNQGNLIIDKDWKLWMIDHTRAFRDEMRLRDPRVLRRVSGKMLQSMRDLKQNALEANLMPYITRENIKALLFRRDLLVHFFENEIRSKGSDAVLTDIPRRTQEATIP